ncbi:hypothetical protein ACHAWF_017916, partial [Thalassiosira exigua]
NDISKYHSTNDGSRDSGRGNFGGGDDRPNRENNCSSSANPYHRSDDRRGCDRAPARGRRPAGPCSVRNPDRDDRRPPSREASSNPFPRNRGPHLSRPRLGDGGKLQFRVLYTHQKTKKKKSWKDGRLVLGGTHGSLFDACPNPGSGGGAIDSLELTRAEAEAMANGTYGEEDLESEKFLIQVEGPWVAGGGAGGEGPVRPGDDPLWNQRPRVRGSKGAIRPSAGMKRVLAGKFKMPGRIQPLHPEERRRRAREDDVTNKRRRPLQPGGLEWRYYGDGGGEGGYDDKGDGGYRWRLRSRGLRRRRTAIRVPRRGDGGRDGGRRGPIRPGGPQDDGRRAHEPGRGGGDGGGGDPGMRGRDYRRFYPNETDTGEFYEEKEEGDEEELERNPGDRSGTGDRRGRGHPNDSPPEQRLSSVPDDEHCPFRSSGNGYVPMVQDASWTPSKLGQVAREAQEEGCEVDDNRSDGNEACCQSHAASCRLHDATIDQKDRD